MSKTSNILIKAFAAVFAPVFLWLSWLCLTESLPEWLIDGWILQVSAGAAALMLLLYAIGKGVFANRPSAATLEKVFLAVGFLLYIALQVFFAFNLWSTRSTDWDFNVVAGAAMDYCTDGIIAGKYFRRWPNNIPLFLLLVMVFKPFSLLGISLNGVGIGFNILCIDIAIFITYLTLKKLRSSRTAGFIGVALLFLTLPILAYVAIYYTDTVTLPFPILTFYLWLLAKDSIEAGNKKQAALRLALMGAAAAFGGRLKLSAAFMLVAVIIDVLLRFKPRDMLRIIAVILVGFLLIYIPTGILCANTALIVEDKPEYHIPKLHWIMMGLKGNGNYNNDDYQFTLNIPPEIREERVKEEVLRRLQEYGLGGFLEHLHEKHAFIWGEASYMTAYKLDRSKGFLSLLHVYLLYYSTQYTYAAHYNQGFMVLNLVSAAAAGFAVMFSQKHRDILPCLIALFGLFLFLSVWEARSRYIFNYLPVFITITACCLCGIGDGIGKLLAKITAKKA